MQYWTWEKWLVVVCFLHFKWCTVCSQIKHVHDTLSVILEYTWQAESLLHFKLYAKERTGYIFFNMPFAFLTKRKKEYGFGMTHGWINDERTIILCEL